MAIKLLGSSATPALRHQVGSRIQTNEFGTDIGTVNFLFHDAAAALRNRPARGAAYAGNCAEFNGFFADTAGQLRIVGGEALIPVVYKAINPGWGVPPPERSHDLEMRDFKLGGGVGTGGISTLLPGVPIPHPVITYKFASAQSTSALGTYSLNPPNAPTVEKYDYQVDYVLPSIGPGTTLGVIPSYTIHFVPNPLGWLCLKDNNSPACGGRFFEIEQMWKCFYIFIGYFTTT